MPARRIAAAVSPLLNFVEWLFSDLAAGVDLFFGAIGAGLLFLMLTRPGIFAAGNFAGMDWMSLTMWIVFMAATVSLHLAGLFRLHLFKMRFCACLMSSWYWLTFAFSLTRVSLTTGSFTYSVIGLFALISAIYISGRSRRAT